MPTETDSLERRNYREEKPKSPDGIGHFLWVLAVIGLVLFLLVAGIAIFSE
jgi:hypothetical protein